MNTSPKDAEIEAISKNFLRKKLFVMIRHPFKTDLAKEYFADHLKWMVALEERGILFGSGPFVASKSSEGKPGSPAGGMTILRAQSIEEAKSIVQSDPYVMHEVVTFEMKEWLLMEGGFNLRVSFSQGTYTIE
jgi:uncharacterized protein YciI